MEKRPELFCPLLAVVIAFRYFSYVSWICRRVGNERTNRHLNEELGEQLAA